MRLKFPMNAFVSFSPPISVIGEFPQFIGEANTV
jgi:hypothetical protein